MTEPVGWIYEDDEGRMIFSQMPHPDPLWEPVYKAAPKRKWVGLADEEIEQIVDAHWNDPSMFVEAIEAKLKAKNG
jgi:hypothetical protein